MKPTLAQAQMAYYRTLTRDLLNKGLEPYDVECAVRGKLLQGRLDVETCYILAENLVAESIVSQSIETSFGNKD